MDLQGNSVRPALLGATRKLIFPVMSGAPVQSRETWIQTLSECKVKLEGYAKEVHGVFMVGNENTTGGISMFWEIKLFELTFNYELKTEVPGLGGWLE